MKDPDVPIYPEIKIEEVQGPMLLIRTYVRKKHRGKYYLSLHQDLSNLPASKTEHLMRQGIYIRALQRIQISAYKDIIFGKVDTKRKDRFEDNLFIVDQDQSNEQVRITLKIFNLL